MDTVDEIGLYDYINTWGLYQSLSFLSPKNENPLTPHSSEHSETSVYSLTHRKSFGKF